MISADRFSEGYIDGAILSGMASDQKLLSEVIERFHTEGWIHIRDVLTKDEVEVLRKAMDRKLNDRRVTEDAENDYIRSVSLMRMFEYSQAFRDLIIREPIIGIVEKILGEDCHVIAQNALRTIRGNGIVNWHIDDHLFFPCPDHLLRHDPQWRLPCYALNAMFPLTNIEMISHGPTQLVPQSHFSGRRPTGSDPLFDGQTAISVYAKAGDVYLLNNQVWHRGGQNESRRVRYVATIAYGRRFVSQRFYPFLNYRMPAHVLEGVDNRLLRLLGKHPKGPYG